MSVEQGVVRDSEAGTLTLKDALQGMLDERATEAEEGEGIAVEEEAEEVRRREHGAKALKRGHKTHTKNKIGEKKCF